MIVLDWHLNRIAAGLDWRLCFIKLSVLAYQDVVGMSYLPDCGYVVVAHLSLILGAALEGL